VTTLVHLETQIEAGFAERAAEITVEQLRDFAAVCERLPKLRTFDLVEG
jgi:hypothetical protein